MREHKSIASVVRRRIERGGPEKLWTFADFDSLPAMAVAAALSRLAKKGTIRRLRKGVYCMPRESRFGTILPEAPGIVAAELDKRGIAWKPSGLPVYNALGLTTQVSPVTVFDVDRPVSSDIGRDLGVRLRVVPEVKGLNERVRAILDALRDLKSIPDTSPDIALNRVINFFRSGEVSFSAVARAATKEPPRVRALAGTIGSTLGKRPGLLKLLKESLNPLTVFKLGIAEKLPAAREWAIR